VSALTSPWRSAIRGSPDAAVPRSPDTLHPRIVPASATLAAATMLSRLGSPAASDARPPLSESILAGRSYPARSPSATLPPNARVLRRTGQPGNSAVHQRVLRCSNRALEHLQASLYALSTIAPEAWDISENARQKMRVRIAERQNLDPRSQNAHAYSSRKCPDSLEDDSQHDLTIFGGIFWIARRLNLIMYVGRRYCPALVAPTPFDSMEKP